MKKRVAAFVLACLTALQVPVWAAETESVQVWETAPVSDQQTVESAVLQEGISVQAAAPAGPAVAAEPQERTTPVSSGAEGFVERLYQVVLGREVQGDEALYWTRPLMDGTASGASVAAGFFFSPEYLAADRSEKEFIADLYRAMFGRQGDADGTAYWLKLLEDGVSRDYVFRGFVEGTEFSALCASYGIVRGGHTLTQPRDQNPAVTAFVSRLYRICLERAPDPAGLNDWCARLLSGELSGIDAAAGFVFSQEFLGHQYDGTQYVLRLYRAFLGREADEAGLADWTGQLEDGASWEHVFNGFACSAEFAAICAQAGIRQGDAIVEPGPRPGPVPVLSPSAADVDKLANQVRLKPLETGFTVLDEAAERILQDILKPGMTQAQILRSIFAYSVNALTYGVPAWRACPGSRSWEHSFLTQARANYAYQGFTDTVGTCVNFTAVFAVLANRAGFETVIVGDSMRWGGKTQPHEWALINLDGQYYIFDPQVENSLTASGSPWAGTDRYYGRAASDAAYGYAQGELEQMHALYEQSVREQGLR